MMTDGTQIDQDRRTLARVAFPLHNERSFRETLPARFQTAGLAQLPETVNDVTRDWLNGPGWGLVYAGPPGRGKSWAMAAAGARLAGLGSSVTWLGWQSYLAAVKRSFDTGERISDPAEMAGFVLIDDLAAERPTDWSRERLLHVISIREAGLRKTIITTNSRATDFNQIDARIASRLAGATWLSFTGRDRRPDRLTMPPLPDPDQPPEPDEVAAEAARRGLAGFAVDRWCDAWRMVGYQFKNADWRETLEGWHEQQEAE